MPPELPSEEVAALERALLSMDRVAVVRILVGATLPTDSLGLALQGSHLPPIPMTRIDALLVPALRLIGSAWGAGRAALSQVYMAAKISEEIVDRVDPELRPLRLRTPRVGLAVLEDRHELGKRIVGMTLRAAGYPVRDYGAGVSVPELAEHIDDDGLDMILVSTLMLRSAIRVEALADALARRSIRPRLIVGGAPYLFDDGLWREVGADAMGVSAADAIGFIEDLVEGRPTPPAALPGLADLVPAKESVS
jgi:methanogenic corrinoid protein MtbC1